MKVVLILYRLYSYYHSMRFLTLLGPFRFQMSYWFTEINVSYRVRKSSEYADCYGVYSGFYSTSLLFGTGCVDGPGSLSGGAFNQLKLVTLDNVRTFLY